MKRKSEKVNWKEDFGEGKKISCGAVENLEVGKLSLREQVEYLLKNYHQIKREIEMITPLINKSCYIEDQDIMEAMTFKRAFGERVQESGESDKTSSIALIYKDIVEKERQKALRLEEAVKENTRELLRLENTLEALEEKQKRVLKGIYIDGKKRRALARELFISENTLNRLRKKGIEELVRIYEKYFYTEALHGHIY